LKKNVIIKYSILLIIWLFCASTFSQTQGEINQEAIEAYNLADAEMTTIYKSLMGSLTTQTILLIVGCF